MADKTSRQIRRAFGPQALAVIDNHADNLVALNEQVAKLALQMGALLDGSAAVNTQLDALVDGQLHHAHRLSNLEQPKAPAFLSLAYFRSFLA